MKYLATSDGRIHHVEDASNHAKLGMRLKKTRCGRSVHELALQAEKPTGVDCATCAAP